MNIAKIYNSKRGTRKIKNDELLIFKTIKGELYFDAPPQDKIISIDIIADSNINLLNINLINKLGSINIIKSCNYINEQDSEVKSEYNFEKMNIEFYDSATTINKTMQFAVDYYSIKKNYIFVKSALKYFQFRTVENLYLAGESQYIYTNKLYDITIPYIYDGTPVINYSLEFYANDRKIDIINCNVKEGEAVYIYRIPALPFDLEINIPNNRVCIFRFRNYLG